MQELINALKSADDDYLTALSNKGTVKRSHKDLDTAEITVEYDGNTAEVSISGEKCTIVSTLAESKCSCPSRSICRHIITSILWLKNNIPTQNSVQEETQTAENVQSDIQEENSEDKKGLPKALTDELSSFPIKEIQKAMKKRCYNSFIAKAEKGILPNVEEMNMVTVELFDENVTVKLISPLEYSACTCHSKELCKHKATAILAWQIKHKIADINKIKLNDDKSLNIDVENIHNVALYTLKFLSDLLSDGLVRASDDIVEHTETIAVMCHNARLADCERLMRETGNRLKAYISHSAEFNVNNLFSLIMENMILITKIIKTDNPEKLNGFLGEFKNAYEISNSIEIIPVAWRHFSSVSGYEGEVYYFINKDTTSENRFLTYSDIRPKFYETSRKSRVSVAPWGLYGSIREISKSELKLRLPKLSNGKISSSSETTAEITSSVNLNQTAVYENIYTDFSKMVYNTFSDKSKTDNETDKLVMFAIKKCVSSEFDSIEQTQNIVVEDEFEHIITIKAKYTAENKSFIEQLINIGEAMLKSSQRLIIGKKQYVIFGSIYIENGNAYIYPMAVFDNIKCKDNLDYENSQLKIKYLKNSFYFFQLFKDIEKLLCEIIQCGINSFDLYTQVKDYSQESQKMGLLILSDKLTNLYEMLKNKNHSSKNDNSKIIPLISDIYNYVLTGQKKTELGLAIENLDKKEIDKK